MGVKKRVKGKPCGFYLDEEMLKAAGLAESEEYQVIFGSGAIVLTDGKPERIVLSIVDLLWMLKQEERERILSVLTVANQYYLEEEGSKA